MTNGYLVSRYCYLPLSSQDGIIQPIILTFFTTHHTPIPHITPSLHTPFLGLLFSLVCWKLGDKYPSLSSVMRAAFLLTGMWWRGSFFLCRVWLKGRVRMNRYPLMWSFSRLVGTRNVGVRIIGAPPWMTQPSPYLNGPPWMALCVRHLIFKSGINVSKSIVIPSFHPFEVGTIVP